MTGAADPNGTGAEPVGRASPAGGAGPEAGAGDSASLPGPPPPAPDAGTPVPSGLRDPQAAVRRVGSAALAVQALVLLLAIAPLARLGGSAAVPAIVIVLVLVVVTVLLAGLLRYGWAWPAAFAVPAGLAVGGWLHWSLAVLGILFGLLWGYVLYVRAFVLGRRRRLFGR